MREHVGRHLRRSRRTRVTVIPNGIDPIDLLPVDDLDDACARASPRRDEKLVLLVGPARLREGLPARARGAARTDRARSATCASSSPARAPHEQELRDAGARARPGRARHVPGLDRRRRAALALPDRRPHAWCRRSTSRSAWWRWRRWPRGCPCIVADTGGLREVVPEDERVGLRFNGARRRSSSARWSSACSPTTSCATGSWPRPPSTC